MCAVKKNKLASSRLVSLIWLAIVVQWGERLLASAHTGTSRLGLHENYTRCFLFSITLRRRTVLRSHSGSCAQPLGRCGLCVTEADDTALVSRAVVRWTLSTTTADYCQYRLWYYPARTYSHSRIVFIIVGVIKLWCASRTAIWRCRLPWASRIRRMRGAPTATTWTARARLRPTRSYRHRLRSRSPHHHSLHKRWSQRPRQPHRPTPTHQTLKEAHILSVSSVGTRVRANTMASSHARDARVSSNGRWGGIWRTHVGATGTAPSTSTTATNANTAGSRSVSRWACGGKVRLSVSFVYVRVSSNFSRGSDTLPWQS